MDIAIRETVCPGDPYLLWDTSWNAADGLGQWSMAGPREIGNAGGLAATSPIVTSVINLLFTDRRCPPNHPLAARAEGDPRGWWGDGVLIEGDPDQQPLGSLLWLVTECGTCTEADARWARQFAEEALAPLVTSGAVASVKVEAVAYPSRACMVVMVDLFGRDGARVYSDRFERFWRS